MCSGAASASHTLTSGKLNELIDLFVGESDTPTRRWDKRRIEAQTPTGFGRLTLIEGALNARQDQAARRTAFARGKLMQPTMQIMR